ncbi:pseudouridine synthase [Saccharophagus degradans]|uniref:pseudouridine synthase n=1 Tax=Saccharophagus degradans TaxID=86304 RepID=UPI001C0972E3|nr:pseudouridine synthase [Saccharophagus degradans]MBU2984095.1 pseudouridine synthase [Saccharophagus degradans]
MASLLLINKPYNTLCQFTDGEGRNTLANLLPNGKYKDYYPAGRLDLDSEGLLILTNDGSLQHRISHPSQKLEKTYWVQVEGDITQEAIAQLEAGVELKDGKTKPAKAKIIAPPQNLWERNPPVRERKNIPTSWLSLTISEGKNRQVRRMTAAVNYPTLRLIRAAIGPWQLGNLAPGNYKEETVHLPPLKQKPRTSTGNYKKRTTKPTNKPNKR